MLERVSGDDMARRAAAASIATNAVLMVLVGVVSGSVAVLSDGIDSLEDVIAAGITYASLRYGARPPDATHPYGHGSAETLAATFQGPLIGAGGVFILFRAVDRVPNPPDSIDTGIAMDRCPHPLELWRRCPRRQSGTGRGDGDRDRNPG